MRETIEKMDKKIELKDIEVNFLVDRTGISNEGIKQIMEQPNLFKIFIEADREKKMNKTHWKLE